MRRATWATLLAVLVLLAPWARGNVVINEIYYHAPNDFDDLQWVELHNTAGQPVDLAKWSIKQLGITFDAGAKIDAGGFLVLALKEDRFRQFYNQQPAGIFTKPMKHSGGRLELMDAAGKSVDVAVFKDEAPYPSAADGYSASLERICPGGAGDDPENWAASSMPRDARKPSGTPAARNENFSEKQPPAMKLVSAVRDEMRAGNPMPVVVEVKSAAGVKLVEMTWQTVFEGKFSKPVVVKMAGGPLRFNGVIPAQKPGALIRYSFKAQAKDGTERSLPSATDLRPTFSTFAHGPWDAAAVPYAIIFHVGEMPAGGGPAILSAFERDAPDQPHPPRGVSAFAWVDPKSGKTQLFDHINIVARTGGRGWKVHFHKDKTLEGMSTISVIWEGSERFILAEALAYDLFRRAGNPACLTEFARVWNDGKGLGYYLVIEEPSKAFLRRNKIDDEGDLYKLRWFGNGVEGQNVRKTNEQNGHADLIKTFEALRTKKGDELWKYIQENIDVQEMANFYACLAVLSYWDGYFNNYFSYHDIHGTGKWQMYPWDQDKTWGTYDGLDDNSIFFDLPLGFGAEGDQPPADNAGWWRPGGDFSRPLLAEPHFRAAYLARIRELCMKVYTRDYFAVIDQYAGKIQQEVRIRAQVTGGNADAASKQLQHNADMFKQHLLKRRAWLLDQKDVKNAVMPQLKPATRPAEKPHPVKPQ